VEGKTTMNPFVQQMINHKLNHLTPEKLHSLAEAYEIPLTMRQAKQVVKILREQPVDIVDATQRKRIIKKIATRVDPMLAKKINALLQTFL
jgi:phage gp29-like protein